MEHPTCPRQSGGIIHPTMPNVKKRELEIHPRIEREKTVKNKQK
jgi:hypothetical protein